MWSVRCMTYFLWTPPTPRASRFNRPRGRFLFVLGMGSIWWYVFFFFKSPSTHLAGLSVLSQPADTRRVLYLSWSSSPAGTRTTRYRLLLSASTSEGTAAPLKTRASPPRCVAVCHANCVCIVAPYIYTACSWCGGCCYWRRAACR